MKSINLYEIARQKTQSIKEPQNATISSISSNKFTHEKSFGFETLLDVSVITENQRSSTRCHQKQRKDKSQIRGQVLEMKEKLSLIQNKTLNLYSDSVNSLDQNKPNQLKYQEKSENSHFVESLKNEIMKEKLRKLKKAVENISKRIFFEEIRILDETLKFIEMKRKKMKRKIFETWKKLMIASLDKKVLMQAIRERICEKRKNNKYHDTQS